ncbi:unnamed protein product [Vitrella brassicaformis CCMP3155]|uniref:Uncharacterized protein n=2 Tax=Vitrella brassicaformis TaxID=1169539 RepID=A0A0G4FF70_VITBC|nr:unnamed protein product [Vitrella brassicaformis CCMP3155]|mmetsp:Transcript_24827/g.71675  ORF Transcript_24827/g.71675 Transcript_24827/m.71675 type:complete len:401 (+) Transcript_24827:84-1286(+)|eukprot:CEM11718.1 unnamed protein product [Vitrella brassicaformis CCMP3155]
MDFDEWFHARLDRLTEPDFDARKGPSPRVIPHVTFVVSYAASWAFACCLLHLYDDVPRERTGASSYEIIAFNIACFIMLQIFVMELFPVISLIFSLQKRPAFNYLHLKLKQATLNLGLLLVGICCYATLICNSWPVFIDPVTGNRLYGARLMEWTVSCPLSIYLTGRLTFGRPLSVVIKPMACMSLSIQLALAATLLRPSCLWLRWAFGVLPLCCFLGALHYMLDFLVKTKTREPGDGEADDASSSDGSGAVDASVAQHKPREWVKKTILGSKLGGWTLCAIVFHLTFLGIMPPCVDQILYTVFDATAKLVECVSQTALRTTEWDALVMQVKMVQQSAHNGPSPEMAARLELHQSRKDELEDRVLLSHLRDRSTSSSPERLSTKSGGFRRPCPPRDTLLL